MRIQLLAFALGAWVVTADAQTVNKPIPVPVHTGPGITFEFPAIEIGIAEYEEGPTGTTMFYFPKGASVAVDVRGGAPGTIGTDFLRLSYPSQFVDAVVFSGGSSYGLSAATGVAEGIKSERTAAGDWGNIATVVGAIVFDLGGRRFNAVTPDDALGRAAFHARKQGWFPLGNYGAGRFTTQGGFFGDSLRQLSGQGGAFRQIGPTKIAVFTVVNALGTIVDRSGNIVRCGRSNPRFPCGPIAKRIADRVEKISYGPASKIEAATETGKNTTLTLVVTNQKLPHWALQRLAVQVHTSIARAIQPYSTENDGDVLYAVSTQEVENPRFTPPELGFVAGEVAWDAVLASVPAEIPLPMHVDPWSPIVADYVGTYEFSPTVRVKVREDNGNLMLDAPDGMGIYLAKGKSARLTPLAPTIGFLLEGSPRRELVQFTTDSAGTTRMIINPATRSHRGWPLTARRISR